MRGARRVLGIWLVVLCFVSTCAVSGPDSEAKFTLTSQEQANYSKSVNWGLIYRGHSKPDGCVPFTGFSLKKFKMIYVKNIKKKRIYLTFDCGYEAGYTKKILDTLKRKKVKAIFFITKCFLEEQPKLVKRMKKEGHLVGSHTMNHPYMAKCSNDRIKKEIKGLAKLMKKKTGYKIDKFFRPPYGNYSIRVLNELRKMGYTTVLWSLAWYDYDQSNQPTVDYVVNQFKNRYHRGMIPLLHNISSADTEALPGIISFMKSKGYKFKLFTDD